MLQESMGIYFRKHNADFKFEVLSVIGLGKTKSFLSEIPINSFRRSAEL
jgi:hypothetical protein